MNEPAIASRSSGVPARLTRRWLVAIAFLLVEAAAAAIVAQDAVPTAKPAAGPKTETESKKTPGGGLPTIGRPTDRIQYVGPDTYILLDSEGRPQPMPGMSYEDFLAAWKRLNQPKSSDSQPRFSIESIRIEGQTHGQRAELQLDVAVRLLTDGPADVPLGLVGAILQGEPKFAKAEKSDEKASDNRDAQGANSNDDYLSYDPEQGGFVARLAGHAAERKSMSLSLIVPLVRDGAETTLPLNCPRSLSSHLSLIVDAAVTAARTSGGTVLSQAPAPGDGTRLEVAGPAGPFRLTWQTINNNSPEFTSALNALGAIRVTIDGRGVRSDVRLTVRSYGGTFDQFRVRLPLGAQLVQDRRDASERQEPKYRVRVEKDTSRGSGATKAEAGRQVVLVEFPEKQQGPVVVDLSTELSSGATDAGQAVEVAGFEVLGAVRQFGDVALDVADDWQARWEIGPFVRQVDHNELDPALQRSKLTAAFQYDRQPWSLSVRVAPRQLRVHVTPRYELECLPEEARLTVRLAYQVFGARAFEFRVEMNGWEMNGAPVESNGLVDQESIFVTPEGILKLPLAQASSRRAEVSFSVRRPLTRDSSRLELPMPVPVADSVGTGELIVRTAPDIDLLPDLSSSTGLTASPTPPAMDTAVSDAGRELHFRSLLPAAVFVADRANRKRDVAARTATEIEIGADQARVEQRVEYVVRYEPIQELFFEAPSDLSQGPEGIEIAMLSSITTGDVEPNGEGTPLHVDPVDDEYQTSAQPSKRQFRAVLSQPRVGKFAARIRYRVPLPSAGLTEDGWQIPLVHPVDGYAAGEHATVRAPRNLSVVVGKSADGSSWKSVQSRIKSDTLNSSYEFVAEAREPILPLVIRAVGTNLPSTTIVDRVWLQTWLSTGVEQDRSTFRFRSSGSQATVELPPDTASGEIEVLVDRQPAELLSRAPGRVVVRLSGPPTERGDGADLLPVVHTLELRYRRPYRHSLLTRHRLTPPQIEGTTALAQVYWQIVLPSDEHVAYSPKQLTSATQWQWLGSFWGRRPLKSQAELEEWIGASAQLAPTADQNQYLYTGLLPVSSIELVTAPRWLIVLVASAVVLALVTAWLYLPIARRPWILVALIVLIVASSVAFPTAALLAAQASAIGVVLAALSVILSRLVARPTRWSTTPTVQASSQGMPTPRAESILMPPVMAAASTAPTATLRLSDSEQ